MSRQTYMADYYQRTRDRRQARKSSWAWARHVVREVLADLARPEPVQALNHLAPAPVRRPVLRLGRGAMGMGARVSRASSQDGATLTELEFLESAFGCDPEADDYEVSLDLTDQPALEIEQ